MLSAACELHISQSDVLCLGKADTDTDLNIDGDQPSLTSNMQEPG